MSLQPFFDSVPRITFHDPLAEFLGAAHDGRLEYAYGDAVRFAGHSCPTVAMAYALTVKGLQALYPDELPERGAIIASFPQAAAEGVTGVVSGVVGFLTGATETTGFKGIGGRFVRRGLMQFGSTVTGAFRLSCAQGGEVALDAQLDRVPAPAQTWELLARCLKDEASGAERDEFRALWQGRVRRLLVDHWNDADVWQVSLR
ncbi:MAG: hypothetical protein Q7J47_01530 [Azoarcus sp.]|nr:hypothetical protein [Azoarcus sp.]